jgi:hypothetical protein
MGIVGQNHCLKARLQAKSHLTCSQEMMTTIQIILNAMGIVYFLAILTTGRIDLRAESRVTELDRAGVFNEVTLKASFPQLADNLRYNVAEYVAGDYRRRVHTLAVVGLMLLAANLVIICLNGWRFQKRKESANPQV